MERIKNQQAEFHTSDYQQDKKTGDVANLIYHKNIAIPKLKLY